MATKVQIGFSLPESWFAIPSEAEADLVSWAGETAAGAWQLRARAGVPEAAVPPGAGEQLVVGLTGLAFNVREQVALDGGHSAAVWLPIPERGIVSAVMIVRSTARGGDYAPETYLDSMVAAFDGPDLGGAVLHTQRIETELPLGVVHGLHSMHGVADSVTGTSALEERVTFAVFPTEIETLTVEVQFMAERLGVFDDMPLETFTLLRGMDVRLAGRS